MWGGTRLSWTETVSRGGVGFDDDGKNQIWRGFTRSAGQELDALN